MSRATQSTNVSQAIKLPGPGEAYLWRIPLRVPAESVDSLGRSLSPDEIERAERFVFEQDRQGFIVARGKLRAILAAYLDCLPHEVRFGYGPHGKPFLLQPDTPLDLQFNLSHSGDLALCAVTLDRPVGVDLEWIRPNVDVLGIARSTFSTSERDRLEGLLSEQRLHGFYACWTRKEAYIKARGEGLSFPLDAFDVSLEPGVPAKLLRSREGAYELRRWALHSINAGPGYSAALAVERPFTRLTYM